MCSRCFACKKQLKVDNSILITVQYTLFFYKNICFLIRISRLKFAIFYFNKYFKNKPEDEILKRI